MRPNKFRAWHNTTVNGNFIMSTHEEIVKNCGAYLCDDEKFPNRIIMQFTGLTDKNGVDIYEGDILFADGNNSKYTVKYGYHELTSHYDYSPHECTGFYLNRHNGMDFNQCESIGGDCSMLSVIGNEHQSPELMESK